MIAGIVDYLQRKSFAILRNTRERNRVMQCNFLEDIARSVQDACYIANRREYAAVAQKYGSAAAISMKDQMLALLVGQCHKTLRFGIILNPPRTVAHNRLRTHLD